MTALMSANRHGWLGVQVSKQANKQTNKNHDMSVYLWSPNRLAYHKATTIYLAVSIDCLHCQERSPPAVDTQLVQQAEAACQLLLSKRSSTMVDCVFSTVLPPITVLVMLGVWLAKLMFYCVINGDDTYCRQAATMQGTLNMWVS